MKKVLFIFALAFLFFYSDAQVSINNYVFSTNGNASLARSNGSLIDDIDMTTGTTVVLGGSAVTNTTSTAANLNFDFYSGGQRFTNFTVTPNGWVGLGGGVAPTILWSAAVFSGTRIAPFLGPLLNTNIPPLSSMTTSSIGRVHYKLIGTSPSRVGVIEFLRMSINSSVVDDTNTFQVRLYESNGAIEFVYGRMKITAGAPLDFNIGFKIAAGSHSVNATTNTSSTITTTTNNYTTNTFIPNIHSLSNGFQRSYTFTPNAPNPPTNFTISNVTNNGMTLNWTDASNETAYVLYRSIDGGSTYTFVQQLAANVTTYVATGLPSNTDVYWRIFSIRESLSSQQDNMATTLGSSIITSVTDGNWNNTATWSTGTIPTANDSVLISTGDTVLLNVNNATCLRLSVDGALHYNGTTNNILTILTNLEVNPTGAVRSLSTLTGSSTLNIGQNTNLLTTGSIINNGIIDIESGTNGVTLNILGNGNSTISGTPSVFKLRNLQIQKNNNVNNIVDVLTPFSVFLTANTSTLSIFSGTLRLSCAINLTPYGSPTGTTIVSGTNSRLWFNHPNAVINSTTTPPGFTFTTNYTINGELRMDNGTLNIGYGNSLFTIANATLNMNGGTINVLGGFSHNNQGTMNMSGGTINLNPISGANALPNTTAAFLLGATANVNITGGTINLINPQTNNNNTSINILSGGSKSFTGGTLKIGNGLGNGTPVNPINTAGFGITSQIPLWNVEIDTRYDLTSGRLVRIVGDFLVGNNLTIANNSFVLPANGNTGGAIRLFNQLVLNGQIINNFPSSASQTAGLVSFEGTSNQLISGTGTFLNLANLTINNANGVTSSLPNFGSVVRINLLRGLLTTTSSIVIGSSFSKGIIQIGGLNETTPAGTFNVVPTPNSIFPNITYIYAPSSSNHVSGSYNEMPSGAVSLSSLIITDNEGFISNRNLTVVDTLNLGSSNLNIGNNSLSIGTGILNTGLLLRSTGYVSMNNNGQFNRWYANSAVLNNSINTGFPILVNNQDRSLLLNSDGIPLITGGSFSVKHANISGNINISPIVPDGSENINRISNSYWVFNSTGITVQPFFGLQVSGNMQGMGSVSSLSQLRFMKPSLSSGGTSSGTGSLSVPYISRLFSSSQIASGGQNDTFYVGVNSASNTLTPTYIAVANGSWDNPLTWNNNAVPNTNNTVIIPSPYTVNLNSSTFLNTADSIAVLAGGTLSVANNSLNVNKNILCEGNIIQTGGSINIDGTEYAGVNISATTGSLNISGGAFTLGANGGSNRTLLVNGTLSISDSTILTVNGNVSISSTATFNQSGGNLIIDGNSGTAFTSTIQGVHLLDINTNNINCNNGNIIFIDPPHASLGLLTTNTLRVTASSNLNAFSGNHTFIFGDGISTTIGNNNGFNVDNRRSGIVPLQNVIVNGGNITGRWLSPSFSSGSFGLYAKGSLTINAGSEVRQVNASQLVIGGNIINNGILTIPQTLTLGGLGYTILDTLTISGTGVFRNSATTITAEFNTLNINSGGVVFNLSNPLIRIGTALNLTSGLVKLGIGYFKIPVTANITRGSGYITQGGLELNFGIGANISKTYFFGSNSGYAPTILTFPTVFSAGDVRLTNSNSDNVAISSSCIDNTKSINKNWNINNISVLPYNLNVDLSYTAGDIDAGTTISNIIGKMYNGTSWSNTTLSSVTGTNTLINGITNNGEIQLGEILNGGVSINIATASATACYGTNVTYTATVTAGGSSPVYQWKKNGVNVGTNSSVYINSNVTKTDTVWCNITSNSTCVSVLNATSDTLIVRVGNPGLSTGLKSTFSTTTGIQICHGSNTGLLTFTADLPVNIIRWDTLNSRVSGNWGPVPNTTSTYTSGPLNAYGHNYGRFSTPNYANFKVIYNFVGCTDTTESNILNFEVNPTPTITNLQPDVFCGGSCTQVCFGNSYTGGFRLGGVYSSFILQESVAPYTTWTTPNLDSMIVNKRIRAIAASGVCPTVTGGGLDLTVIPKAVKGTLNGNRTICSGSPTGIVYSGYNGFLENWSYSVAPFTSWSNVNGSTQISNMPITQTTKFVAITFTDLKCQRGYSDTVTITVNPNSVPGTVIGSASVCAGSNSGLLQLNGFSGNIVNWESSVAPFTTWTTIANTSSVYTSGALTQTTKFRAAVQSGACSVAYSIPATITVNNTISAGTLSGGTTICSGTLGDTLRLTGHSGNVVRWEKSLAPFTSWNPITNNADSLVTGILTDTTKYRVITSNGGCGEIASSVVSINVIPVANAGTISGPSFVCAGSDAGTLVLNGNIGNVVNWESAVSPFTTFTTITNTTSNYNPGVLTQNTQFRAIVQNGSCGVVATPILAINISTTVLGGNVSAPFSSLCSGATPTKNISLNGHSGAVTSWQSATGTIPYTWTNIAATAGLASFVPSAVTTNTVYRALVQSGTCGSAVSDSIIINADAASNAGTLTNNGPVCVNSNATLTLTGNVGNIVRWESATKPFTTFSNITGTSNPFTSPSVTDSTEFRAIVKNGACNEVTSNITQVILNNATEWMGTTDTNWHVASNWTCGVPTINSTVYIASHVANSFRTPTISTQAFANDITLYGGCHASSCATLNRGIIQFTNNGVLNLNGDLYSIYGGSGGPPGEFRGGRGTLNLVGNDTQKFYINLPLSNYMPISLGNVIVNGSGLKIFDMIPTVNGVLDLVNGKVYNKGNFIISATGSIIGGNTNSFIEARFGMSGVVGYLTQNNIGLGGRTGDILYPVGFSGNYHPFFINNTGVTDNFTGASSSSVASNYANGEYYNVAGIVYSNNVVNKTISISEEVSGGSNLTVSIPWNASEERLGFDRTNCYVATHNGGSTNVWYASPTGSAIGTGPYSRSLSGITSDLTTAKLFSVGSSGTLPVKLIKFNGVLVENIAKLTWTTASEINNKAFEIERSVNGVNFEYVGFVKGVGNSNSLNRYAYNDNLSSINYQQVSSIYYRLKQIDQDGKYEYSNTIVIKTNNDQNFGNNISIVPNPFTDGVQINYSQHQKAAVKVVLVDALGREVYTKQVQSIIGNNAINIDNLNFLQNGIYFVRLESNGTTTKVVKLLKN